MADNEKKNELEKAAESKPAKVKEDKPSVFARAKTWFKSVKSEWKKVAWASPKSVKNNTIVVLIGIIVFSAALGILDYLFSGAIVGLSRLI